MLPFTDAAGNGMGNGARRPPSRPFPKDGWYALPNVLTSTFGTVAKPSGIALWTGIAGELEREDSLEATAAELADLCGQDKDTVLLATRRLESLGLLHVDRTSARTNRYSLIHIDKALDRLRSLHLLRIESRDGKRDRYRLVAETIEELEALGLPPPPEKPVRNGRKNRPNRSEKPTEPVGNSDRTSRNFRPIRPSPHVRENKEQTETTNTPLTPQRGDDGFEEFWQAYPRKRGKKAAHKVWRKLQPSPALLAEILAAVARQRVSPQWTKEGGQYIPYPATFLNGELWEDEVEDVGINPLFRGVQEFVANGDWGPSS